MNSAVEISQERLSWHVPTSLRPTLRFELTRVACVTCVFGAILFVMSDPERSLTNLGWVILCGLGLAGWRTLLSQRRGPEPENVWLDAVGLHWINLRQEARVIHRDAITGYWIGHDEQTRFAVPSLTLLLREGFLSQPIELHAPAAAEQVIDWLDRHWQIPRLRELPVPEVISIPLRVDYDEDRQIWRFLGSRVLLEELLEAWRSIAEQHALPPVGARPKRIDFAAELGEWSMLISPQLWIEDSTIAIDPERLRSIATQWRESLAAKQATRTTPLECDSGHRWQLVYELITEEN